MVEAVNVKLQPGLIIRFKHHSNIQIITFMSNEGLIAYLDYVSLFPTDKLVNITNFNNLGDLLECYFDSYDLKHDLINIVDTYNLTNICTYDSCVIPITKSDASKLYSISEKNIKLC